jgi:CRP-like cAMP-binding protein
MVQVEGLDKLLKEHPFFEGFDAEALDVLAGCAANERFEAGTYIFKDTEPADKFYILRHGDVAIEMQLPGRERLVLQTVHNDEILGWSWMVPPYEWAFDARAISLVRAITFDAACLRGKCDSNHELGYRLMQKIMPVMANRLAAARLQMVDMYAPLSQARKTSA